MSNLTPTAGWDAVPQMETTTQALGGPGGPMNLQAQALLNRTEKLAADDAANLTAANAHADSGDASTLTSANAHADSGLATKANTADLADTSAVSKGAAMIGGAGKVVSSIAGLRALLKTVASKNAFVTGYYAAGDGGGGAYYLDITDTTSTDNGGSIIVATDGGRWKLQHFGTIDVRQFGAKGDNTADDYATLQAALTFVGSVRGLGLTFSAGKYKISQPLIFQAASVPAALSGSDLHFSEHVESQIHGNGDARIIATASMAQMLLLQPNAGTSSIGPFYTTVQGILFDCNNLATTGIESNYSMNLSILKNKIWRPVTNGIFFTGYGVAKIRDNVIKAPICINFAAGGGDSDISANDLYPAASGRGVNIGKLAGDAVVDRNVFNGEGNTGCIGVYLDGATIASTDTVLNVRITNNEFSGMSSSIYGQRHASARNIFGLLVEGNHTIPAAGGAVHTGQLANLNGVDDAIICNNFINGLALSATLTTAPGIQLSDCRRPQISGNKFGNLLGPAAYFTNVVSGEFCFNEINDVGRNGSGGVMVDVDAGTTGLICFENILRQSSSSYAQNPIYERSGANGNEFLRNHIFGCSSRINRVGSTSVVAGRVVASGAYSLTGGTGAIQANSHGFTISRTATGVCTVTLATARQDSAYRVKANSDAQQIAVDSYAAGSFVVRTYNGAGTALDAALVQIEVTD